HAEDDGPGQEHRLPQHRGFGFDAADAPSQYAEAVDHRSVRIGTDQGVGEEPAVSLDHDTPQVLQVDLMANAHAGRHDAETIERLLCPVQQCITLAVAPVLPFD